MKRGTFLTPLLVREGFLGLRSLLLQQVVLRLQLGHPGLELLEPAVCGRNSMYPLGGLLA